MKFSVTKAHKKFFLFSLVIAALIVFVYAPSFSGSFILDDRFLIEDNTFIKTKNPPIAYFMQEDGVIQGKNWQGVHTGYYRPFVNLTYRIDYLLWGTNAAGYRATNVFLHILTSLLFLYFMNLLFSCPVCGFWIVLVFALHPLNTETVSWISSRNNILVTLFGLLTLTLYVLNDRQRKFALAAGALFAFSLAVFTKEFGLIVLPVLFLYERFLSRHKKSAISEFSGYIPYILIIFLYFILKMYAIGPSAGIRFSPNVFSNLFFIPFLLMWNLRLVFIPVGLHSFTVSYPDHFYSFSALGSTLCIVLFLYLLIRKYPGGLILFSVFAFMLAIFPVLHVFKTASVTLVSMRWLYFPLPFLLIGAVPSFHRIHRQPYGIHFRLLCILCAYLAVYNYFLNGHQWHNEQRLYQREVCKFDNSRFYGGYAEMLFQNGEIHAAEIYFRKAIRYYPNQPRNHINFAAMLIDNKRTREALDLLNRVKESHMEKTEWIDWHNNIGVVMSILGNYGDAVHYLKKAISVSPDDALLWKNLGICHVRSGNTRQAIWALEQSLRIDPAPEEVRNALSMMRSIAPEQ